MILGLVGGIADGLTEHASDRFDGSSRGIEMSSSPVRVGPHALGKRQSLFVSNVLRDAEIDPNNIVPKHAKDALKRCDRRLTCNPRASFATVESCKARQSARGSALGSCFIADANEGPR